MQEKRNRNHFLFQLLITAGFHVIFLVKDFDNRYSPLYKYYSVLLGVASVLFDIYGCLSIYLKNVVFHLSIILAVDSILLLLQLVSPLVIYSAQCQKDLLEYFVSQQKTPLAKTFDDYFRSFQWVFYFWCVAKVFVFFMLLVSIYKYRKSVLT
jgi:hypothetical protein